MSGAISLSGMGALRSGVGLATLAVPDLCLETVAALDPCYMTQPLPCDDDGRLVLAACEEICHLAEKATCVAIGPGLGRSEELTELVGRLYDTITQPMIVDADALNALASRSDVLDHPGGPRIITPHPGEFRRLAGAETLSLDTSPERAVQLAADHGIVVVLKGHRTVVTDGDNTTFNETGNPGMATGGVGDVLTGIIAALVCQGLSPLDAARLGVHVHGLAGDLAVSDLGEIGMVAGDLVDSLPEAFVLATLTSEEEDPGETSS